VLNLKVKNDNEDGLTAYISKYLGVTIVSIFYDIIAIRVIYFTIIDILVIQ